MANQQVVPVRTSTTPDQMIPAFIAAWKKLMGNSPSKEQIAMLMSHNALETGGFTTKAMFNYNIGNITKTPSDSYDYFVHPDSYHGKKFMSKFRSYSSLEDGVYDYLNLLKKGYPQAFRATNQTPKDFAYALVANPKFQYYDDTHREEYAKGMTSLYNQAIKSNTFNRSFQTAITQPQHNETQSTDFVSKIENLLSRFLSAISTQQDTNSLHKRAEYKQYLPEHRFLIKLRAEEMCDALEFARVLATAMGEELLATSKTFCQGKHVEMECYIHGNQFLCAEAVSQLCGAMSDVFATATHQVGNIVVTADIFPNDISNYQELDIKLAEVGYQVFHHKIAKAQVHGN